MHRDWQHDDHQGSEFLSRDFYEDNGALGGSRAAARSTEPNYVL